jgi:Bacterial Ig-like domain (group 2)
LDATANVPGTFSYTTAAGTILKAGEQTLSAVFTPADTKTYATATASVNLTVTKAAPIIAWPPLPPIKQGAALSSAQLNAVANVPGTLVYTPAAGTVLPPGIRPLTATFSPADASDYTSATANNSLTVQAAPTSTAAIAPVITWKTPVAIRYGTTLSGVQLNATAVVPGSFAYTPIAGTILKAGTQTLTVLFTPSDTKTYSAATLSAQLAVDRAAPLIAWAKPGSMKAGSALSAGQLNATASVPGSFTYSPPRGTVLPAGTRPLAATFTPSDAIDYIPVTANNSIQVSAGASTTAPAIAWNAPPAITYGTALRSTQLNATANVSGTFAYSPAAGTVLKAGSHTLSVTFTPAGTTTYSAASAMVLLMVTKAIPLVTWNRLANIAQGAALGAAQLDAAANVQGVFSYNPISGTVLPVGSRQLTVNFSPSDATDYATVTANNSLTIVAAPGATTPDITWNPPPAIAYGTALGSTQLNATANVPGTFAYSPAVGMTLKAGKQTLFATFTPTDSKTYSAATASVQLTVNRATPTMRWATPAPITAGTALSATQLDVKASVPGSFIYNPAVGAVLAVGTQPLAVVFSPTDTTDYSSATAHTSLVVGSTSGPIGPGTNCALTSGVSISTIQGAINAASTDSCAAQTVDGILLDGRTVLFTAGTYTISSQIFIPCPSSSSTPLIIEGPPPAGVGTTWPVTPTAVLTSALTNNWAFRGSACSVGTTFQYVEFNGGRPAGGGGGFLFASAGMNNLTVTYNYFHGNQAITSTEQQADTFVWLDGSPTTARTENTTITWNRFGASGDCSTLMHLFGGTKIPGQSTAYQGNVYNVSGGLCAAVGVHVNYDNLTLSSNNIIYQEQGFKFHEAGGPPYYTPTTAYIYNNDFAGVHRIGLEAQQGNPSGQSFNANNNSLHDFILPGFGSWLFSLPQGGQSVSNCVGNVFIGNVPSGNDENGNEGVYVSPAVEFWGNGTCSNNLVQGLMINALSWGFGGAPWSFNNNIIQLSQSTNYFDNEEGQNNAPPQSGNVTGQSVSAVTSHAPTISPSGGSQTFPLSVTLADAGDTSGVGPQGNTGIWYTTDGSTPVPGSGTAQYLSSGQTFTLSAAATAKAVGMWGALNQPTSYPSGYGFVPSSVVTASYATGSIARPAATARISSSNGEAATAPAAANSPAQRGVVAPALESVAIVPSQPDVAIGSTTQLKAIATFDDGSTKDVTADFAWTSSDPRTVGTSSSGVLAGLASGKALIAGSYQRHQASVAASSALGDIQWSGPIVITRGGTYSGNWQSNDPRTPAVTVSTTEPVIVENSHIRSVSGLIKAETSGSDLIVRNNVAVAANAAAKGQPNGIFLQAASPARLDVENNYIENASSGVVVHGYSGNRDGKQTIVIRANRARNLSGLLSDGSGGYLPGEGPNRSVSRFIELDTVQAVPGIDVGWNEVINYPGRSLVSDNIEVNRSSGTPNQPLEIHDTYIQGAYPYRAAQDPFNGGGIKTEGGSNDSPQETAAFSSIHDNQVVGTVGYGIAFTAGHDNIASNNRVISSGLLADGTRIAAQGVGLAEDAIGGANASVYNNTMRDNLVGWMCWKLSCAQAGYRNDVFFPASPADYSTNSAIATGEITVSTENNEYQVWLNKLSDAAVTVGPAF